jgi:hypothetical protein
MTNQLYSAPSRPLVGRVLMARTLGETGGMEPIGDGKDHGPPVPPLPSYLVGGHGARQAGWGLLVMARIVARLSRPYGWVWVGWGAHVDLAGDGAGNERSAIFLQGGDAGLGFGDKRI